MKDLAHPPGQTLKSIWRKAHEEALAAYRYWTANGGDEAYAVYRAAEDRADAALTTLRIVRPS